MIVYTRNVSSLKTEKNLQELINTILDRLPLGVFVKDGDNHFNYLYWNHFMEEITGIETREIEGHDDFEVNYNALMTAEERLETDMNVIKTGLTARFKGKVKSASGDYRDIEVAKYPISLNNGKPLVLALWRDITSSLSAGRIRMIKNIIIICLPVFAEGKSLRQGSRHVCYFPARRNMFGERYSLPCMNGTIKEDLRLSLDVQRIFRNGRIKN